jgi:hypothetical protein
MTPTTKLRFVKRLTGAYVQFVLQQWWGFVEDGAPDVGEWRDVETEEEE